MGWIFVKNEIKIETDQGYLSVFKDSFVIGVETYSKPLEATVVKYINLDEAREIANFMLKVCNSLELK